MIFFHDTMIRILVHHEIIEKRENFFYTEPVSIYLICLSFISHHCFPVYRCQHRFLTDTDCPPLTPKIEQEWCFLHRGLIGNIKREACHTEQFLLCPFAFTVLNSKSFLKNKQDCKTVIFCSEIRTVRDCDSAFHLTLSTSKYFATVASLTECIQHALSMHTSMHWWPLC